MNTMPSGSSHHEGNHGVAVDAMDPLSRLLGRDRVAHPVEPSPWFAARTVAKARSLPNTRPFSWKRLLIPVPLAGLAALVLLASTGTIPGLARTYISSDSEFEQHMDLLVADLD